MQRRVGIAALAIAVGGLAAFAWAQSRGEERISYLESERVAFAESVGDKYKCTRACAQGATTPYCQAVRLGPQHAGGVRKLAGQLKSGATIVSKAALMNDFGAKDDPCGRSDTKLQLGRWTNSGESCLLATDLDVFGDGKPVKFELSIPADLAFVPTADSLGRRYSSERGAVTLRIHDEDLNNDWGGALTEVIDRGDAVLLQLPRGCVKIGA